MSTRHPALALSAICLAALLFGLEISSVPIILPVLEAQLRADFQDLQWTMNAYTIACTTVLMATGTLADRYGRRRVFSVSVLAFGIASLLCGLAPSMPALIGARFAQGLAAGAMFICSIAILSHQFPEGRARARAFAAWGVVSGIGLGFGPVVGGAIIALTSWQWVFLVHVPLSLIALALIRAGVVESRDPQAQDQRLDWAGIATLTVAVLGLSWLITQGSSFGWTSPAALGLLAATLLGLVGFVVAERLHPRPMFDFSVFRIRDFSGAIIGCVGMNCSYWPFMVYLPLYFTAGMGWDISRTGLALLVYTVPFLVMPPIAQWLLLRYQARIVIPSGLFTIGLGFMLYAGGQRLLRMGWLDRAAWRAAGWHRAGPDDHARHQHDDLGRAGPARRHGLGHGCERAADHAGAQHRRDGRGACRGHRVRVAHGTGAGRAVRAAAIDGRAVGGGQSGRRAAAVERPGRSRCGGRRFAGLRHAGLRRGHAVRWHCGLAHGSG